jgi:hypothetical protein
MLHTLTVTMRKQLRYLPARPDLRLEPFVPSLTFLSAASTVAGLGTCATEGRAAGGVEGEGTEEGAGEGVGDGAGDGEGEGKREGVCTGADKGWASCLSSVSDKLVSSLSSKTAAHCQR